MLRPIISGIPASAVPHSQHDSDELCIRLREHVQRLRFILPVISVAVMALRQQNAELDEDIASVLHQHATDPLDLEIEAMEEFLESLTPRRVEEVAA